MQGYILLAFESMRIVSREMLNGAFCWAGGACARRGVRAATDDDRPCRCRRVPPAARFASCRLVQSYRILTSAVRPMSCLCNRTLFAFVSVRTTIYCYFYSLTDLHPAPGTNAIVWITVFHGLQ